MAFLNSLAIPLCHLIQWVLNEFVISIHFIQLDRKKIESWIPGCALRCNNFIGWRGNRIAIRICLIAYTDPLGIVISRCHDLQAAYITKALVLKSQSYASYIT